MDKAQLDKLAERLKAVNEVVKKLEPTLQPEAVRILVPYVTGEPIKVRNENGGVDTGSGGGNGGDGDLDALQARLVQEHGDGTPSDNALLAAAVWFAQYGKEPFSLDDLRATATSLGLTIPDRPDAFFGTTKRNGKKLFARARKGFYHPTVHGETFLKATYGVTQGKVVLDRG